MRRIALIMLTAVLLTSCAGRVEPGPRDVPVESYVLVDVDDINARVRNAAAANEEWVRDPRAVAERFVRGVGGRYLSVERVDELTERPQSTTITIIRAKYLDDSVWGDWNQLLLSRASSGAWYVDEARRAWRCHRGHQTRAFGERLCL